MNVLEYPQTPSQTVGPYFAYGLCPELYRYDHNSLIKPSTLTESDPVDAVQVHGFVYDAEKQPINDAMIDIVQHIEGQPRMARTGTGVHEDFHYSFIASKSSHESSYAPHLNLIVFMRGLLSHVFTRMYFEDEVEANAKDPLLQSLSPKEAKKLMAKPVMIHGQKSYAFDIYMQGEQQTPFFDL